MCMLITGKSAAVRNKLLSTEGLIESLYKYNSDGLGVMYATAAKLKVIKKLPDNTAAAKKMIEALPNDEREVAIHWRMRTHGHIDLVNCHPYEINASTYMMHNGILATGNKADTSKSDTWHFIKNYLASLPVDALHDKGFHDLVGELIENNRFAIMSADGRLSVVNADQGFEKDEVWFSNTYAMDAELVFPEMKRPPKVSTSFNTRWEMIDSPGSAGWMPTTTPAGGWYSNPRDMSYDAALSGDDDDEEETYAELADLVCEAVEGYDPYTMAQLLESHPRDTIDIVLDTYKVTEYKAYSKLSVPDTRNRDMWVQGDRHELVQLAKVNPEGCAEALIYNCNYELDCSIAGGV